MSDQGARVRSTVYLDESFHGMERFLRDKGWNVEKFKRGVDDDHVADRARSYGGIVVTGDGQLIDRCRRLKIEVIDVGFAAQLDIVLRYLDSRFPKGG